MENCKPSFPLFINLSGERAVVVGGGSIACRRVKALLPFGCAITVIAPAASPELYQLMEEGTFTMLWREYRPGDVLGAGICVAATNDREVNRAVGEECRGLGIPVSVADCREECTFYFPAVARCGDAVIGITASGQDHKMVRRLAGRLRELLPDLLDETTKSERTLPEDESI